MATYVGTRDRGRLTALPVVDRAGRHLSGVRGVDDDGVVRARPCGDEIERVAGAEAQHGVRQCEFGQFGDQRRTDSVVTPEGVADPDDDPRRRHSRATVTSRKWVAHEMHGS